MVIVSLMGFIWVIKDSILVLVWGGSGDVFMGLMGGILV